MRIIAACILALVLASSVRAADVDWKLYGGASVAGPSFCFYDASGVARTSNGYIRVWTKCLAQSDLESAKLGDKNAHNAAEKIVQGYLPPIIVIGKMDFKQIPEIVMAEEVANLSVIEPQAQIFYEMNCSERMTRMLSVSIHANGKSGFQNKPSDWEYDPPDSNGATLSRLLCPKQ